MRAFLGCSTAFLGVLLRGGVASSLWGLRAFTGRLRGCFGVWWFLVI